MAPQRITDRLFESLNLLVVVGALVLGGATQEGAMVQAAVRLLSLPLFFWAAWRLTGQRPRGHALWSLALLAAVLLVPAIQLIPLPPAFWRTLPGRADFAATYGAAGMAVPWLPLSLTPDATWDSGLALLPPAAVFLAVTTLRERSRNRVAAAILGVTALGLLLGLMQMATGPASPLRFYVRTNVEYGVGFFANRNHQAALLLTSVPLAAHFIAARRREDAPWTLAPMLFGGAVIVVAAVGVVAAGSRAGLLLLGPAVVAGFLIATRTRKFDWKWSAVAGVVLVGIVATAVFVDPEGLTKLRQPLSHEVRAQVAPVIAQTANHYFPVGTGLGSFDPVYRTVEPERAADTSFLNHAHDDYLELWLETGLVGIVLLILFFYWFGRASWRAWISERKLVGASLGRAGSTVAALLLVHSVVDYPLRTTALAVVFAFACAVLNPPASDREAAAAWPPKPVRPRVERNDPGALTAPQGA
ncbi:MAG TPA: O-antigen ligase family protein [Caulobacteraceae bacterium]|jgi:hypothetical protein|nr:O-antigen ligase family protein [Caulobacteraceae bacterium]